MFACFNVHTHSLHSSQIQPGDITFIHAVPTFRHQHDSLFLSWPFLSPAHEENWTVLQAGFSSFIWELLSGTWGQLSKLLHMFPHCAANTASTVDISFGRAANFQLSLCQLQWDKIIWLCSSSCLSKCYRTDWILMKQFAGVVTLKKKLSAILQTLQVYGGKIFLGRRTWRDVITWSGHHVKWLGPAPFWILKQLKNNYLCVIFLSEDGKGMSHPQSLMGLPWYSYPNHTTPA